ncbi:MAG TPA: hypothetical protein DHV41_03790 [Parachlamydiales bacterium]|nr:MAG: hypothetical protein A3D18_00070 [Chlamydiae bacterium RIFCSPHIGHO2_02_FULL_49_29]OGN64223.1 MAG: hypothetical protein A3E26_06115 [Chlamydiae bacterium RIFCSPHIGHO2_12_FULL_49_32]OGN69527.1 MAG: hypothetical protein A3I15_02275 [Chlamydiae bacterium RIFCSPLOWO2_02_FULL_49_12]HCJ84501.1 hypothetical protein [Parachlamydiales bacterium]
MKKAAVFLFLFCSWIFVSLQAQTAPPSQEAEAVQTDAFSPQEMKDARPEPPSYEAAFFKMILALLLLLFVVFFVIWGIRRLGRARMGFLKEVKHIRIVERRPLSPKTSLYLIETGKRRVLVAESQLEIKALTTEELIESSQET